MFVEQPWLHRVCKKDCYSSPPYIWYWQVWWAHLNIEPAWILHNPIGVTSGRGLTGLNYSALGIKLKSSLYELVIDLCRSILRQCDAHWNAHRAYSFCWCKIVNVSGLVWIGPDSEFLLESLNIDTSVLSIVLVLCKECRMAEVQGGPRLQWSLQETKQDYSTNFSTSGFNHPVLGHRDTNV